MGLFGLSKSKRKLPPPMYRQVDPESGQLYMSPMRRPSTPGETIQEAKYRRNQERKARERGGYLQEFEQMSGGPGFGQMSGVPGFDQTGRRGHGNPGDESPMGHFGRPGRSGHGFGEPPREMRDQPLMHGRGGMRRGEEMDPAMVAAAREAWANMSNRERRHPPDIQHILWMAGEGLVGPEMTGAGRGMFMDDGMGFGGGRGQRQGHERGSGRGAHGVGPGNGHSAWNMHD